MADIKWIKLAINMHEDEKMKLIDAMPKRDTIHYIWIRILLLGGKINSDGEVFLSDGKALTAKMLAILFSRPLNDIKLALKVLSSFEMIEITPNKVIKIVNWNKHQNIEGMEKVREQNRKRAEDYREKKKIEKKAAECTKEENLKGQDLEDEKNSEEKGTLAENKGPAKNESLENLETCEEASEKTINNDKTNTANNEVAGNSRVKIANNNEDPINSIVETADNNCNVTKNISNVTQKENNVTVMEQNKKENKKKNKKEKKEIDKDKNIESHKNNDCDLNNKSSTCGEEDGQSIFFEQNNTKSQSAEEEDINLKALELMQYHEKITGKVGGGDYVALRSAIEIHGEKWVKMAMEVGFERNCPDIKYAIGVLKNWRRDGYPEDIKAVNKNGTRSTGKNNTADKNEFAGFKPKEPRKLTEEERRKIEANLI